MFSGVQREQPVCDGELFSLFTIFYLFLLCAWGFVVALCTGLWHSRYIQRFSVASWSFTEKLNLRYYVPIPQTKRSATTVTSIINLVKPRSRVPGPGVKEASVQCNLSTLENPCNQTAGKYLIQHRSQVPAKRDLIASGRLFYTWAGFVRQ